ncbi:MAG: type II toxin-antitoxin system HicA family toxin [Candidatus Margulisbacteria bacterium]|jgi:predicted RNA binding protein YcfA (HicA-like mRNA interferase family)|nr:type II toxin-antitoxin system HicA family toxin [Candidatus Margulisiibacteriota bacterium]
MPLTGKQMLKLLLKNGWTLDRVSGSHHVLQKADKTLVVPYHAKDLGKGLEKKILKEAGLK